jgi:hypothetical protein
MTYLSLRSLHPKCTSKEGHEQTNILLFQGSIGQFTWRPTHVLLLLVTYTCHNSCVLHHSIYYVIDSDTWLKGTHRVHRCASNVTIVTPARYSVTLCCLSYSKPNWNLSTDFKGAFCNSSFRGRQRKVYIQWRSDTMLLFTLTPLSLTDISTAMTGDRIWMVLMTYHEQNYRRSKIPFGIFHSHYHKVLGITAM